MTFSAAGSVCVEPYAKRNNLTQESYSPEPDVVARKGDNQIHYIYK